MPTWNELRTALHHLTGTTSITAKEAIIRAREMLHVPATPNATEDMKTYHRRYAQHRYELGLCAKCPRTRHPEKRVCVLCAQKRLHYDRKRRQKQLA